MVQKIEELQAKLHATKDEDEQRALEEDITGKILWLCWCGVCAAMDQLLPKVVDHIRKEGYIKASYVTYLSIVITTVSRLSRTFTFLNAQRTQVMIKITCSGSCLMQEQGHQNISYGLPLGKRRKPSGLGTPPLWVTQVLLRVQAVNPPPHRWFNKSGYCVTVTPKGWG
ncbi:hypothetical protein BKA82DRAFT_4162435 [Pisolithus tinctorius]|nr:hypothetical protein BKA82DRAFT_4162435 [Pisolithus tinctorius]